MITFPESVITGTVDGELVLLDSETGTYFGLNRVATRMVEILQNLGDEDLVVAELTRVYNVPVQRLREDLRGLLNALGERGLVVELHR